MYIAALMYACVELYIPVRYDDIAEVLSSSQRKQLGGRGRDMEMTQTHVPHTTVANVNLNLGTHDAAMLSTVPCPQIVMVD